MRTEIREHQSEERRKKGLSGGREETTRGVYGDLK
jgi:hypothetical protein